MTRLICIKALSIKQKKSSFLCILFFHGDSLVDKMFLWKELALRFSTATLCMFLLFFFNWSGGRVKVNFSEICVIFVFIFACFLSYTRNFG